MENINTSQENPKESNIKGTIDAITGLAKEIPVYNDAIQPAAKEIGKSLATIAKTINIALAPISALVWGYEKISEFVQIRVAEKLRDIPEEDIVTPDPSIVGPALEALKYLGNKETLSELYANLIANSMDKETINMAHPGFVEIIKNLTSDEGLILQYFLPDMCKAIIDIKLKPKENKLGEITLLNNYSEIGNEAGCKFPEFTPRYIDNLCRLGLLNIPSGHRLIEEKNYDIITNKPEFKKLKIERDNEFQELKVNKKCIELTELGIQFRAACVTNKGN